MLFLIATLWNSGRETYDGPYWDHEARQLIAAFERDYGYDTTGVASIELLPYVWE